LAFTVARRVRSVVTKELYTVLIILSIGCIKVKINLGISASLSGGSKNGEVDEVVGAGVRITSIVEGRS
jgi:hypothetical protein